MFHGRQSAQTVPPSARLERGRDRRRRGPTTIFTDDLSEVWR